MPTWTIDRNAAVWSELNGFVPATDVTQPAASSKEREEGWERIFAELREIRKLEDDWDGLGAKAPSGELVDSAMELAELLRHSDVPCPSRTVPGVNGTILIEWQVNGIYLEAEVCEPYYAECMKVVPGKPAEHWEIGG